MPTLADVAPKEFTQGEYSHTRAYKMREYLIRDTHKGNWPGTHKNVNVWWDLANGYAVGWNENPSRGWSFPVINRKQNRR